MKRAVLIKSCRRNSDRIAAITATWAPKLAAALVPVWMVTGGHSKAAFSADLSWMWQLRVSSGDDYSDNSHKLRDALRHLLSLHNFTHLFIVDDDTLVHPGRWLAHEPAGELECRVYRPITDAEVRRNGGRPWVTGGAGWWMSRRLCELYVELVQRRCSWDDVLVAGVAQDAGVPLVDRPDLYTCARYGRAAPIGEDWPPDVITYHPAEPAEMRRLYATFSGGAPHGVSTG